MGDTLDSKEAAELFKLTVPEFLKLARRGEFPGINYGNKWVFLKSDLLEYLRNRAKEEQLRRLNHGQVVQGQLTQGPLPQEATPQEATPQETLPQEALPQELPRRRGRPRKTPVIPVG